MPPPKLPADRPIAFFAEPIEVAFGIAGRHDVHMTAAHSGQLAPRVADCGLQSWPRLTASESRIVHSRSEWTTLVRTTHGIHRHLSQAWPAVGKVAHLHKPLVRQVRLDRRLAAVAMRQIDFT